MAIFKGPTRAADQLLVGPSIPNLGDTGWYELQASMG